MREVFECKLENESDVTDIILTAIEKSKNPETVYLMSNGEQLHLIHKDYIEEYEVEGYWVASIYEYGNRVEF
jgi:hypothetical protein